MYTMQLSKTRLARLLALSAVCGTAFFLIYRSSFSWTNTSDLLHTKWSIMDFRSLPGSPQKDTLDQIVLVVASQKTDNTTWLETAFPSWQKAIYLTDGPSSLSVPANKGRESMVYLRCTLTSFLLMLSLTYHKLHNRQLRQPPINPNLPACKPIPMAQ